MSNKSKEGKKFTQKEINNDLHRSILILNSMVSRLAEEVKAGNERFNKLLDVIAKKEMEGKSEKSE